MMMTDQPGAANLGHPFGPVYRALQPWQPLEKLAVTQCSTLLYRRSFARSVHATDVRLAPSALVRKTHSVHDRG